MFKYIIQLTNLLKQLFNSKLVFSFYCLIIILLVTLPLNSASELVDITIFHFRGDYFFHALIFLPWALFQLLPKKQWLLWILIGLLFAACSELIQFFLSYRAFNINDLLANTIGILFGLMIWFLFNKVITNS